MNHTLSLLFVFLQTVAMAGTNPEKPGNKEIKAEKYFNNFSFSTAIRYFKEAGQLTATGKSHLAAAYLKTGNTIEAGKVYEELFKSKEISDNDLLNYASCLNTNKSYDEEDQIMGIYISRHPQDAISLSYKNEFAKRAKMLQVGNDYSISNMAFNSEEQEFGPAIFNNELVFSSSRHSTKSVKRTYNWNEKSFLDMYKLPISEENAVPTNFEILNSNKFHDGPASFGNDNKTMVYTTNCTSKSKNGSHNLELFFSEFKDNSWSKATSFEYNDPEYSVGHPWLSKDGKTLYFASNMPGGFGGTDLYRCVRTENNAWSKPENLGKSINTEKDEMYPFVDEKNSILYFASNGHFGLGGLDLFAAKLNNFNKILNLGNPVNSERDDFAICLESAGDKGYFSSNRPGGKGDDDIYKINILRPLKFGTSLQINILDEAGKPLKDATVTIIDKNGKQTILQPDADGNYSIPTIEPGDYKIAVNKKDYFDNKREISISGENTEEMATVALTKDPGLAIGGLVYDNATKAPLEGAKISILLDKAAQPINLTTDASGNFLLPLKDMAAAKSLKFIIEMENKNYLTKKVTADFPIEKLGIQQLNEKLDLGMNKVEIGLDLSKMINLKPIFFDKNKFNIRPDAAKELDKVVAIMNENPTMEIELGSHTDCRSSYQYNQELSQKRADASTAYIKKRITHPERITGKGYGESKLKNGCACEGAVKSTCTEAEHQENRRTEFIILKY